MRLGVWLKKAPWWSLFYTFLLFSQASLATEPGVAAIASAHPRATDAGHLILKQGGNAFDAAVAVSAVLAVVEPYSSGLGGGGFWLLHRESDGFEVMLDGRERAPLSAHRDLYIDETGEVKPGLSIDGPLAAAIPGEPAALVHLSKKYGRLPLALTLAPAIRIAREGFSVDAVYRRMAKQRLKALRASAEAASIFLDQGEVPSLGKVIRQPDLAVTLKKLADRGVEGFYAGEMANRMVEAVRAKGGIWQLKDLSEYRVVEREPVRGSYQNLRITSAAPPSSGGVALVTTLNILQGFNLSSMKEQQRTHLIVEAMRRAYRDRADYLGDPDWVDIPLDALLHPWYAAGLARDIQMNKATPSKGEWVEGAGRDTTHFSILDAEGNRVAATLSINYPFGSGFIAPGTGVLLNDEMDDFSAQNGVPNIYGLVGGEANAIAGGKRMLSSMSPTFVEDDKQVVILGTPGGSRIISMVLLGILQIAEDKPLNEWVDHPRFHHQYLPDEIQFEPGAFGEPLQDQLIGMGHKLKPLTHSYGNMQAIRWNKQTGRVEAASDSRGIGKATIELNSGK